MSSLARGTSASGERRENERYNGITRMGDVRSVSRKFSQSD